MTYIRNIRRNASRSVLTVCGAALGIAVYVSIQSITNNVSRETQDVVSAYDTDILVHSKGSATPSASRIRDGDIAELKSLFGHKVSPLVVATLREAWNPYAFMLGVPPSFFSRFGLSGGQPLKGGQDEVLVGILVARQLRLEPGKKLPVGGRDRTVRGIFTTGSNIIDGSVVIDIEEARKIVGAEGYVNLALISASNRGEAGHTIQSINQRFPRLKAQSSVDFIGNIRLFKVVDTFVKAVGIITFAGACLVVTNTLLMAVAERTKEIGILMAIGWNPLLILRMLFAESLVLCLCAAVAGNGLAIIILKSLSGSRAIGFGWIPVTVSPVTAVQSVGVSVLLACFAIVWPAILIYQLSPVEALRHE